LKAAISWYAKIIGEMTMEDKNKKADQWYQITYRELVELMNQYWQISQVNPLNSSLPKLAARIRVVAACCDVWKRIATYNATQRFFKGG